MGSLVCGVIELLQAAVIFDMDGTLADCDHRLHFVQGAGKKDWEKFFAGSADDLPNEPIVRLAQQLAVTNSLLIASGRPEKLRKVTESWLKKYELPYKRIYLRKNDDRRSDGLVKADMLELMRVHGYEPWLAVDDRQTAVDAWRGLGLTCLQCNESSY